MRGNADLAATGAGSRNSWAAWKATQLRLWDLMQLATSWLLLAVATISWAVSSEGDRTPAEVASVWALVLMAAAWVFAGHSWPPGRRELGQRAAVGHFAVLLALCWALMAQSDAFIVFAIAGFFHAYLLTPWQMGIVGVLVTSVMLNGSATGIWADPSASGLAEFALLVVVQTAAIGVGIVLMARSEPEERKREELLARLEEALHENAGLHAQLVVAARESGVQDERQRLAREIHDTIAQGLAGIITQLQATGQADAGRPVDPHVIRALDLARTSLAEARRSVQALAPGELSRAQLPDALRTLTEQWARDSSIRASLDVTGDPEPLSPAIEVSLFRVAQESLSNVAKHAGATRVGVTLSYGGPEVLLDVRDDGRGFDTDGGPGAGFGLTSMRQRIRGVGGQVEVQAAVGEGTAVSARVPAIAPAGARDTRGLS